MDRRLFLVSTVSLVGCARINQMGGASVGTSGSSASSGLDIATSPVLPTAQLGAMYRTTVVASNGAPEYTWTISPITPSVSAWLQIDASSGALSGTPPTTGTDTIVISVRDSKGATANKTFTLTVSTESAVSHYVGVNIFGSGSGSYFTSNQKFLNVLKQAGTNNNNYVVWDTLPTNGSNGDLEYDAGGYITSLTGRSGRTYSGVEAAVYSYGEGSMAPGQTYWRPPGSYTFSMTGKGSVSLTGDVADLATSSPGASVSGNTLTSTTTGSVSATFTASGTLATGWKVSVTRIPDSSNYPRAMSLVETQYLSNFVAGEIYHPNFKNTITATGTGGYSRIRFMDDLNSNAQTVPIGFNAMLAAGTTTATMKSYNYSSFAWQDAPWPYPSGTYDITFNNGQTAACTMTWNSATISIGTPLSSPVSSDGSTYSPQAWMVVNKSWANRPLATDFSYCTVRGTPPEACLQLCNEVNCDAWMNHPIASDSTWWTGLAQLAFDGTGATLAGFSGLAANKVCYMELGNEVWNSGFESNYQYTVSEANALFPGATCNQQQWYGMQTANMADAASAIYGSSFTSRVVVVMGTQAVSGQGAYLLQYSMGTPAWTSRAHTHGIGAICVAPYWNVQPNASDQSAILSSASPLDTLFALAYSNNVNGHSYGFTEDGYITDQLTMTVNLKAAYADQPWGALPLLGYESGSSMVGNGNFSAEFQALAYEFHRDDRQQYLYYDPQRQLSSNPGYIPSLYGAGFQSLNLWNDCNPMSKYGDWGALEATMQTISPLSEAPPKYRGWVTFAQS
jgi:Putative Ig domain